MHKMLSLRLLYYHGAAATSLTPHPEDHLISVRPLHAQDNPIALPAQLASSPLQPRGVPSYLIQCHGDRNKRSHCQISCKCRNYSRGQGSCAFPNANATGQMKRYLSRLRATCPLSCKCVQWMDFESQSSASGLRGTPNLQPPATYASVTRSGLLSRNAQTTSVSVEHASKARNASLYNFSAADRAISVSSPPSLESRSVPKHRIHCPPTLPESMRLYCLAHCRCRRETVDSDKIHIKYVAVINIQYIIFLLYYILSSTLKH